MKPRINADDILPGLKPDKIPGYEPDNVSGRDPGNKSGSYPGNKYQRSSALYLRSSVFTD
jgi:hypothetical protein